ncbi:MAG: HAD family phosphatase [Eggerthellaceae bacterium]|nr:HAD family phosphatase [Eggerthellaceae bacterium]
MAYKTTFGGFAPKAFIFDFDGTLVDSLGLWVEVDRLFLERHGLPDDDEYNQLITALGFEAGAAWVVDHFDIGMTADEVVQEWIDLSQQFYEGDVELKPYVLEYLDAVRTQKFPIAIATSLQRKLLVAALNRNDVMHYFDELCICDELASAGKLEPTVFIEAARRLSERFDMPLELSDCVVFEDTAIAAQTARDAGAFVIGMADENEVSTREELEATCDMVISSFSELKED